MIWGSQGTMMKPPRGARLRSDAHWSIRGLRMAMPLISSGGNMTRDLRAPTAWAFSNSPTWTTSKWGTALNFGEEEASSDKCIYRAHFPFYKIQPPWSAVAGVRPGAKTRAMGIFANDSYGGLTYSGLSFGTASASYAIAAHMGNNGEAGSANRRTFSSTEVLTQDTWHHVAACIQDFDNGFLYIDGFPCTVTVSGTGSTCVYTTSDAQIGSWRTADSNYDWSGDIDHVFFYNRCLSPAEVAILSYYPFISMAKPFPFALFAGAPAVTPTPVINQWQEGKSGCTIWSASWTGAANFTDEIIVNVDNLIYNYEKVVIEKIVAQATSNIQFVLELDATTDELLMDWPAGNEDPIQIDFLFSRGAGLTKQGAGGTGNLILSTANAVAGEEIQLIIFWRAK